MRFLCSCIVGLCFVLPYFFSIAYATYAYPDGTSYGYTQSPQGYDGNAYGDYYDYYNDPYAQQYYQQQYYDYSQYAAPYPTDTIDGNAMPMDADMAAVLGAQVPAEEEALNPEQIRGGVNFLTQFFAGAAVLGALGVGITAISKNAIGSKTTPPYIQPPGESDDGTVIPCPFCATTPPELPTCRIPLPGSEVCISIPIFPTTGALVPYFLSANERIDYAKPFYNAPIPYTLSNCNALGTSCTKVNVKSGSNGNSSFKGSGKIISGFGLVGWTNVKDGQVWYQEQNYKAGDGIVIWGNPDSSTHEFKVNGGSNDNHSRTIFFNYNYSQTVINNVNLTIVPESSGATTPAIITGMLSIYHTSPLNGSSNRAQIYNQGIINIGFHQHQNKGGWGMVGKNSQMFNTGSINVTANEGYATLKSGNFYDNNNYQGFTSAMLGFDSNMYNGSGTVVGGGASLTAHFSGENNNVDQCSNDANTSSGATSRMNCAVSGMLGFSNSSSPSSIGYYTMYNSGSIHAPTGMRYVRDPSAGLKSSVYMYNDSSGSISINMSQEDFALTGCHNVDGIKSLCYNVGMHVANIWGVHDATYAYVYNNGRIAGINSGVADAQYYGIRVETNGNIVQEERGRIESVSIGIWLLRDGTIYNNGQITDILDYGIFAEGGHVYTGIDSVIQMRAVQRSRTTYGISSNRTNAFVLNAGVVDMANFSPGYHAYGLYCKNQCHMYNGTITTPPNPEAPPGALPTPDDKATIIASVGMRSGGGVMANYGRIVFLRAPETNTLSIRAMEMLGTGTMVNFGLLDLDLSRYSNVNTNDPGYGMYTSSANTVRHNAGNITVQYGQASLRLYAYNDTIKDSAGNTTSMGLFFNQGLISCSGITNHYNCLNERADSELNNYMENYVAIVSSAEDYGRFSVDTQQTNVNVTGMKITADFARSLDVTQLTLQAMVTARSFTTTDDQGNVSGVESYSPVWTATAVSRPVNGGTPSEYAALDVTMTKNTYVSLATKKTMGIAEVLDENYKGNDFYASFNVATVDDYNKAITQASGTADYGQSPYRFNRFVRDALGVSLDFLSDYDDVQQLDSLSLTQQSSHNEVTFTSSMLRSIAPNQMLKWESGYRYQNFGSKPDAFRDSTASTYRLALGHRVALSASTGIYNTAQTSLNTGYMRRFLDYGTDVLITRETLGHQDLSSGTSIASSVYKKIPLGAWALYSAVGLASSNYTFNGFTEQGNDAFALTLTAQHTSQLYATVQQELLYAFGQSHRLAFNARMGILLADTGTVRYGSLASGEVFTYDTSTNPYQMMMGLSYVNALNDNWLLNARASYYTDLQSNDIVLSLNAQYTF